MKISLLSKRVASLVIALVAGCSLSAQSAVLFHEDWSGYTAGDTAVSSGNWTSTKGLPKQLVIVENPVATLTGKFLKPVYGTDTDMVLLPDLKSVSTFAISPQGISLSAQVAFANTTSPTQYFRIGVEATGNTLLNYWFEVYGTNVKLVKRTGTSTTPFDIGAASITAGNWLNNTLSEFSLNIIPIEGGGYTLSLFMDGKQLLAVNDTASFPTFPDGMRILTEFRDPRAGYLGTVSVESIPEPGTLLFGASALVILVGIRFCARQQPPSKRLF